MDVFGSENMQDRGNFISLMFFVMALGLAAVFFGIGWSTNRVSQVSLSMR
jgi:ATP-binding cassette, subfamily B (MDR/TAP), member 1